MARATPTATVAAAGGGGRRRRRSSAMQNSSLEVCLIGLAPGENAIARKSRLGLYAQQKKIRKS